jgi:hypothetical protein
MTSANINYGFALGDMILGLIIQKNSIRFCMVSMLPCNLLMMIFWMILAAPALDGLKSEKPNFASLVEFRCFGHFLA